MFKKTLVAVSFFILVLAATAHAEGTSVGLKAGILGFGAEGTKVLSDSLGARVGVNYFSYDYDGTQSNIDYNSTLDLMSVGLLLDWHPFKGSFRLTGGGFYNGNEISFDAKYTTTTLVDIGGTNYTGAQLGSLKGKVDFNKFAPYAGLGWDTSFAKDRGLGFTFELGALFSGSPTAELTADGVIATDPTFVANLEKEEDELQSALDSFKIMGVVSIGLNYKF